jgi:hypothetical protein
MGSSNGPPRVSDSKGQTQIQSLWRCMLLRARNRRVGCATHVARVQAWALMDSDTEEALHTTTRPSRFRDILERPLTCGCPQTYTTLVIPQANTIAPTAIHTSLACRVSLSTGRARRSRLPINGCNHQASEAISNKSGPFLLVLWGLGHSGCLFETQCRDGPPLRYALTQLL